jgi:2-polyprenyl-6-methoxyphenol hydroxylase-like FAD-dependent oxidoreductase
MENEPHNWTTCQECEGRGKKSRRIRSKSRHKKKRESDQLETTRSEVITPNSPKYYIEPCLNCSGSGLVHATSPTLIDKENYPLVAIIGGGIGGIALAVACLHRGIPFTIYERDNSFDARSQGYGLTLQQASKAIEGFGIFNLEKGIISTRHVIHTPTGEIISEWGSRNRIKSVAEKPSKRRNIHIGRQSLRLALLEQLGGHDKIQWNHQLVDFKESENEGINLRFKVNGQMHSTKADLMIGADGIRSSVRKLLIGEETTPLRYLGCIVILGICLLKDLEGLESSLLDSATVFQTANGNERIYMMPYSLDSLMWQLSFPMQENEAKALSKKGVKALKEEACLRTQWHTPIPEILAATSETLITGYPVYDRELLTTELLVKGKKITLIGDAAHPMSPFKGQGANQALLDALALARGITKGCGASTQWREDGIRKSVLTDFEAEMLKRSASKVKDSAEAAQFLHTEIDLSDDGKPRGRHQKRKVT